MKEFTKPGSLTDTVFSLQSVLVSRDGEYMMTGGDKGIVEVIK